MKRNQRTTAEEYEEKPKRKTRKKNRQALRSMEVHIKENKLLNAILLKMKTIILFYS